MHAFAFIYSTGVILPKIALAGMGSKSVLSIFSRDKVVLPGITNAKKVLEQDGLKMGTPTAVPRPWGCACIRA